MSPILLREKDLLFFITVLLIVWFINILPYCSKMTNLEVEYRKCPRVLKPMSSQYKLEHLSLTNTFLLPTDAHNVKKRRVIKTF